jgi:peptidoglycan lytic transglycosylase
MAARMGRKSISIWIGLALACGVAIDAAAAQAPRQFSGIAAYYSKDYKGRTASGERYDPRKYTCAHRTLPFGTRVHVTDQRSHRSVDVVVNDRGPFTKGRVIDLSLAAANVLGMTGRGLTRVTAEVW